MMLKNATPSSVCCSVQQQGGIAATRPYCVALKARLLPARVASISAPSHEEPEPQLRVSSVSPSADKLRRLFDASIAEAVASAVAAISAAAQPAAAPAPALKTPPEAYAALATDGVKRCTEIPLFKLLVLSLYAGFYVSFGGLVSTSVVALLPGLTAAHPGLGKLIFAVLFPVGLMVTILHGVELYTGNTMKAAMSLYEGKIKLGDLLKNWTVSYIGNFIGSLIIVAVVMQTGLFPHGAAAPVKVAVAKCSLTFSQAFSRAVLANWFVCLAVWCATSANSIPGKLMAIWPPILSFCAFGGEHSIANMFLIPLGMALGADVSVKQFLLGNLLPVTLGNTFAGAICMGLASYLFYSQKKAAPAPAAAK